MMNGLIESTASRAPLMGDAQIEHALRRFNDTARPYPADGLIHEIFGAQALRAPDAVAIKEGDRQFSYAELERRANQVAHALIAGGVRPDDRVGLYAGRSAEMIIGMLGILKSGSAYLPLDPNYPPDRLSFMVSDSSPVALLASPELFQHAPALSVPTIALSDTLSYPDSVPSVGGLTSRNLAYVTYTSGSTGAPKAAMTEHRSVLRLVINPSYAHVRPGDRVPHCANSVFDATTWEIWAPLLNGATVIVIPQSVLLDPVLFNQALVDHSVTAMWLTVGLFHEYVDALEGAFGGLRFLITGGDVVNPATAARVLARRKRPKQLINAYGPTETTTFATMFVMEAQPRGRDMESLPIGRPLANTSVYVLDENRQPVSIGEVGELYIGGPGVARGYLNRPQMTAERFVSDPFSRDMNANMYKTGDLARWRADGNLEFLGRNDSQVKIRGFRIEPGEIEAQLAAHPEVRAVVVVVREEARGQKELVAYFVPRDAQVSPSVEELRTHLKDLLPEYMVPSALVRLDRLPLTANGKLDRRALPVPQADAYVTHAYEAPQGELEEILARIWKDLLKVEQVGRHDNFFDVGGHSLVAMKAVTRIAEQTAINVSIASIFRYPTIAMFAEYIDLLRSGSARATSSLTHSPDAAEVILSGARNRGIVLWLNQGELRVKAPKGVLNDDDVQSFKKHRTEIIARLEMAIGADAYEQDLLSRPEREGLPLTYSQLSHWYALDLAKKRFMRQIVSATRLRGTLDLEALRESIAAVIRRQEALRTRIEVVDGMPQQRIVEWDDFVLEVDELPAAINDSQRDEEVEQWIVRHVAELIDVTKDPLFSIRVLKECDKQHLLLIMVQHLITDGASTGIMVREIMAAYDQLSKGLQISLPEIPIQFPDYALWQRERSWIVKRAEYWERRLAGYHRVRMPRSESPGLAGVATVKVRIHRDLMSALTAQARRQRTTVVISVFAAYAALLARWCGSSNDIVIQFTVDGRISRRLEHTMGFFAFSLCFGVSVSDNPTLSELIDRAAAEYSRAQDYASFSYDDACRLDSDFTKTSAFNWVTHSAALDDGALEQSLQYSPVPFQHPVYEELESDREPGLLMHDMKTEAEGIFWYARNRYSKESMESFTKNLLSFLETLATRPRTRIKDIPLL
jgi:amino acid adenylation domain-containing protein